MEINTNKEIVLNDDEICYTEVEYYSDINGMKELIAYHTISNKEVGYKFIMTWYENGHLEFKSNYKCGKPNGVWKG